MTTNQQDAEFEALALKAALEMGWLDDMLPDEEASQRDDIKCYAKRLREKIEAPLLAEIDRHAAPAIPDGMVMAPKSVITHLIDQIDRCHFIDDCGHMLQNNKAVIDLLLAAAPKGEQT